MHVRFGLTNGEIVVSDNLDLAEMEEHIAEHDGRMGSGDYKDVRVESVDDAIAFMDQMWTRFIGAGGAGITVMIRNEQRRIDGDDVAWFRWVKE